MRFVRVLGRRTAVKRTAPRDEILCWWPHAPRVFIAGIVNILASGEYVFRRVDAGAVDVYDPARDSTDNRRAQETHGH